MSTPNDYPALRAFASDQNKLICRATRGDFVTFDFVVIGEPSSCREFPALMVRDELRALLAAHDAAPKSSYSGPVRFDGGFGVIPCAADDPRMVGVIQRLDTDPDPAPLPDLAAIRHVLVQLQRRVGELEADVKGLRERENERLRFEGWSNLLVKLQSTHGLSVWCDGGSCAVVSAGVGAKLFKWNGSPHDCPTATQAQICEFLKAWHAKEAEWRLEIEKEDSEIRLRIDKENSEP